MRRRIVRASLALALVCGASIAFASSLGPQARHTGAFAVGGKPAEANCTACHNGHEVNDPNGLLEILDVPSEYAPGALYNLKVRLTYNWAEVPPKARWGFQIQAVSEVTGDSAGTWVLGGSPPESLKIAKVSPPSVFRNRRYLEHTIADIREGSLGPTQVWNVFWRAPDTDIGKIYFFAAGNAANGDECHDCACAVAPCDSDILGDHIFTTAESTLAGTAVLGVPVHPGPVSAALEPPAPNPFAGRLALSFTVPRAGMVDLSVYDAQGRRVRNLVRARLEPGSHGSSWDGTRQDGSRARNGVYFIRLSAPGANQPITRRATLAR
jgi:flagellar hook capping protein FlgD